jgi:hypothetical protein
MWTLPRWVGRIKQKHVGQSHDQEPADGCLPVWALAETIGETVADLAQRIGAAELAEQHGDELRPAGDALGGAFGVAFLDQRPELGTGKCASI